MNLKIGGINVGKIMYNGQEFGGATKLEPGTILYMSEKKEEGLESVHLSSTTKNWNNINGINVGPYDDQFSVKYTDADISGDDFKSLDTGKKYDMSDYGSITVSRSIIDGEYRLNIKSSSSYKFIVKAI